ncbi:hypothetical protein SGFS_047420 [Streptomyces graminofaciens]|uniref:PIN domain-containing protein n=1 Tax=Streptomyces graminofaciens TaxID=68212 RepID=A0ABN5VM10_9ACTN|nr:hypothetical protein SGFS_047420 [Streptomyces graminofaciens]
MARRKPSHEGTLVLDCEGLSKLVGDDEPVVVLVVLVAEARKRGMEVAISALTIIEAVHRRTDRARLARVLSGMRIVPIGDEEARAASAMLISAGLHGHKYAVDAAVAETALRQHRLVVMLTSDVDDITKLCGDRYGWSPSSPALTGFDAGELYEQQDHAVCLGEVGCGEGDRTTVLGA